VEGRIAVVVGEVEAAHGDAVFDVCGGLTRAYVEVCWSFGGEVEKLQVARRRYGVDEGDREVA
jgi:hypothetical protein